MMPLTLGMDAERGPVGVLVGFWLCVLQLTSQSYRALRSGALG